MKFNWRTGQLLKTRLDMHIDNSDGSETDHDEGEYFALIDNSKRDPYDGSRNFLLLSQKTAQTSWWTETAVINNFNIFK